jgi:hypothetical protein
MSLGCTVRGGDGAIIREHVHHPRTALYIMAVLDENKNILRVFESRNEVNQGDAFTCPGVIVNCSHCDGLAGPE